MDRTVEGFPEWRFEFSHGTEVGVIPVPGPPLESECSVLRIKASKGSRILYAVDQNANAAWEKMLVMLGTG